MKTSSAVLVGALCATSVLAAPEPQGWKQGGYRGGRGGKGNWGKHQPSCPGDKDKSPIPFTSTYEITATPDQVISTEGVATGGLPGAIGYYNYGINSDLNLICYYIKLEDVTGEYESAAITATHIHQAPRGEAGPPRIAFPNPTPEDNDEERIAVGCLQGPFETGVLDDNGVDTGAGFHVSQIEADPAAFFTDVHTSDAVPGAVRGQLE